jgi:hypothetical protein
VAAILPAASALAGAAFTVGVCWALGALLLRQLRLDFHRLEAALFAFVSGSACLSTAVFVLCLIHQARAAVFLPGGGAAIAGAAWKCRGARASLPEVPRNWLVVFTVVFAVFFTCYFAHALAPEISPDGSGYHLGNVARYWRHQGFDWSYHSIYSSLSQGMEMLFLVAFSIGRHSAAALVHMAFQTALPLLILCFGRRFGFPRVGAFAALLTYTCPVAGIAGASAYNDLAVATLIFAGFYLLQVNHEYGNPNTIFLSGLLCGFAYALKYSAGLMLPVAAGFTRCRRMVALLLGAALTAGPWMVRNWLWLGNPTAPFLNSWFPNPYWSATAEHQYLAGLSHYPTFKSYLDLFMQLTVLGGLVPGMIGPAFLLAPIALLALRHPRGRSLLLAAAVYSIPAFLNADTRFLIPAIPFLALALGLAIGNSWGALPAVALLHTFLCWPGILNVYCDRYAWRVRGFPIRAALRLDPEADYIARNVGDYALKAAIERTVPARGRIFSFAGRAEAYLDRDVVVGYESTEGMAIQEALANAAAAHAGERRAGLAARSAGVDFLLVNDSDGVAEDIRTNLNVWGVTELAEANGTTLYSID